MTATAAGSWRLRDLDRGGRLVAALVGLLLLVPVAVSLHRAYDKHWVPSGDDALIVLQAFDVLSPDPPLVGQPSTAESYAPGVAARHPGPIEFYALALPVAALGPVHGTLLTVAAITGGSLLLAAWVAFRRGGPAVGLGAAVLLGLVPWSTGTAVLTDPISSNLGSYPLVAGVALAWCLWCDDRRLWPLAALVWSFTIQQHLAIFGAAGLVAAWGGAGAVVTTVRRRAEPGRRRSAARWGGGALAVAVACWLPPLWDQVSGTGNLGKILRFSSHEERTTLGLDAGLRAAGRALAAPPLVTGRALTDLPAAGWRLTGGYDGWMVVGVAVGLVAVVAAAAVSIRALPRDQGRGPILALLATTAVLVVAGVLTTANVPDSVESSRVNFYRWVWPVCIGAWGAVAWTIGRALVGRGAGADLGRGDRPGRRDDAEDGPGARAGSVGDDGGAPRPAARGGRWSGPAAGVALVALAVIVAGTGLRAGHGDSRRDEVLFRHDDRAARAALAARPPGTPVRLLTSGAAAFLSVGPAVAVAFEAEGVDVWVEPYQAPGYGHHRVRPRSPDETVVHVLSSPDPLPADGPGREVARFSIAPRDVWGDRYYAVRVEPPEPGGG